MTISRTAFGLSAVVLLAATSLALPAFAAPADSQALSARSHHHHHHRHYGNSRAALRMFGLMAGTIASIAAANEARDEWRYRYEYGYPPPPPYGYYGYRPYYPY
jgi:hypothetical protein